MLFYINKKEVSGFSYTKTGFEPKPKLADLADVKLSAPQKPGD
ncbi:hypothetical protein GPUN_2602 [Glaciecola punicea ACAM 611]|jgi:hypothetical protein|uniref:Uncharacterized protein n=1 Tax=Glaciecola punicea ACAM 611 TaxID=1121923 RepID=H5TEJ0_9ALTE|nr:hypothetical protein GPUN_2602 [Glaciecola punicea ACAM 611]